MRRQTYTPVSHWTARVEAYGFDLTSTVDPQNDGETECWQENAAYVFTRQQADTIATAANEVHTLCLATIDDIVTDYRKGNTRELETFDIPEKFWPLVAASWERRDPSVYGRIDFQYNGFGPPKFLEYNGDTPAALLESSVLQRAWLLDYTTNGEQFNNIHESLTKRWRELATAGHLGIQPFVHFTTLNTGYHGENFVQTEYLRHTCAEAGLPTRHFDIQHLGWANDEKCFVDDELGLVSTAFKFYPWPWMLETPEFAQGILAQTEESARWFEPMWKMMLSNKAILPAVWNRNPGHPNLLRSSFDEASFRNHDYVVKPTNGFTGSNIKIIRNNQIVEQTAGDFGNARTVTQAYAPLAIVDGYRPVLGVWMVGDISTGLSVREGRNEITRGTDVVVPHYVMT